MSSTVRTLLILRHGETDGNAERVIQTPDTPLNAKGLNQARAAARRISAALRGALHIRSSDYLRAQQTAQATSEATGSSITLDPLLRERNFGTLRGRRYADLETDPFAPSYHPPGGESWEDFFARVASLWEVTQRHLDDLPADSVLLLVTHGLVCRALSQFHLPEATVVEHWANTSLTIATHRDQRWTLDRLNCSDHLNEGLCDATDAISGL